MVDTVNVRRAPSDEREQICLASGEFVAMRLRRDLPEGQLKPPIRRTYETVGFVVSGRALLQLERRMIHLRKGDCWIVPAGAEHAYIIQEPLTTIEATSPPARALSRDGA